MINIVSIFFHTEIRESSLRQHHHSWKFMFVNSLHVRNKFRVIQGWNSSETQGCRAMCLHTELSNILYRNEMKNKGVPPIHSQHLLPAAERTFPSSRTWLVPVEVGSIYCPLFVRQWSKSWQGGKKYIQKHISCRNVTQFYFRAIQSRAIQLANL